MHRRSLMLLGALAWLSACAQTPPTPVAQVAPVAEARLPVPPRPKAEVVTAPGWMFDQDACVARTSGNALSLAIRGDDKKIQITLYREHNVWKQRQAQLVYRGRAGRWEAMGRVESVRRLTIASPVNEQSVSRALILLAGGTLVAQSWPNQLIALRVPPGGRDGQNWFECLKRRLMP